MKESTPPARPVSGHATTAEALERWLGDPGLESNAASYVNALDLDEREELPAAAIDRLRAFGFHRYFVPERLGGELRSTEEIFMLSRVLARRDMNLAVSETTQVWMMLAWLGGDAEQQDKFAAVQLGGGVVPCLAYSELDHGADLAANELRAVRDGGSYVLDGEKWPINRGTTSTHVVLLGATGGADKAVQRRQSLFLLDKSEVVSGTVEGVPRVPTYGLRGCDISGVAFDGVRVDTRARLGAEGEGLELALRGLLITRTFCTGLSLGAGDTMLRTASGFLSRRVLYDGPTSRIPYVSEALANAYLSILVAECESLVAMRGLHLYADEFSVWGNLTKVQVARLIDFNSKTLARMLGARYFIRSAEHQGIFQKMLRDSSVVSVFDGSEPVCLDSVALQLPALAKAYGREREDDWTALYDLRARLPVFEPGSGTMFGRGRDAVLASLPTLIDKLAALSPSGPLDAERLAALRARAGRLRTELDALFQQVARVRRETAAGQPKTAGKSTDPRLMRLAEELCGLHAKIASLGVWLFNRDHLGAFFAGGAWLQAALDRAEVHQYQVGDLAPATAAELVTQLETQRTRHEFFSIRTVRQAAPGAPEASTHTLSERPNLP
ncbi:MULTISPECIES: acyl-CoA dehydrogenase family protein [unclassified Streptomyces]|uniref:acyl-CoA dehydrogenase family protein n=1 Tax=unclassified Streptomyces TaxID=2593676 RepID=UPI00278C2366|nr:MULTISPECIES: acyl-CoA dehydrogenase family protein [unclassified Streptomyces]